MREMAQRYERPDWVRRINVMAEAAGSAAAVVPISAGELIDSARVTTGINEFAELGDGDWEKRLRSLVDAIDHANLHVVGRLMTREELLRCLRVRLLLGEARRRDRAIADERIAAPIVITGPARSGTTILFEVLALDAGLRSPVAADVLHPAPGIEGAKRHLM